MSGVEHKIFARVADRITRWRRPLLVSHTKPDGDALGSLVAMRAMLHGRGIEALALLFDEIPSRYSLFRRFEPLPVLGHDLREGDLTDLDGIVLLDTCAYSQIGPIADWLRSADVPKVAVDHHATRDELADEYVIDETAAATCLILFEWAGVCGWSLSSDCCEALFVGMAMDTGWFRHSNTDARVLSAAEALVRRGVRPHELHQSLHLNETPARVRLLGAALAALELRYADRLAVMCLPQSAMTDCGATAGDTEDIVNEPLRIGSVTVSVLLVEQDDGLIRASFRSKPPERTTERSLVADVDVAEVAQAFGGGGHARAAGARIPGTLAEVREEIAANIGSRYET